MEFYIVIPAHNEQDVLEATLNSLLNQTHPAKKIVVVDDSSQDNTFTIAENLASKYPVLTVVKKEDSQQKHLPGSKVINAFKSGLQVLDNKYDVICKFDADLIFPENYLEMLSQTFRANSSCGMAGGFCYIKKGEAWVLENLTGKDHIRGALKAYRKELFEQMGGLTNAMGWDTVDEIKARYLGWQLITLPELKVKHLKPTGYNYAKQSKYKQGAAFYKMRYGLVLTVLAALKLGIKKKSFSYFLNCIIGYFRAKKNKAPFLLNPQEGAFMRKMRYQGIKNKIIKKN